MNPRELAKQAMETYKKQENSFKSDGDRLPFLPAFGDGEERILRILPPKGALEWLIDNPTKFLDDYNDLEIGPGAAWEETFQHFCVGSEGASLPCLEQTGKPCPLCEAYAEDIKSDNEAIKKSASEIRCKHKTSFFVEWRGHEEEGPFDWSISPKWATLVVALIANNDYTILYDPFKGHDIRVTRTGLEYNNTNYTMAHRPQETFLYTTIGEDDKGEYEDFDFEKAKQVLDILPDISQLQKPVLDYSDYEAILNNEKTVREVYQEKFGKPEKEDDGTDFDPEKIEKESKTEKVEKPTRRRR